MARRTINIVNGLLVVPDGNCQWNEFNIPREAKDPLVQGYFVATGGSGNDIDVFVMDEIDFINWRNGHEFKVYYQARLTTDQFELRLPVNKKYLLVFSNMFSALSSKQVRTRVDLSYEI